MSTARSYAPAASVEVLPDEKPRRIVVVAMLAAIAVDGAAAPATGPAFAAAAGALHSSPALAAWSTVAFDVGYFLAIVLSLRAITTFGKRPFLRGSVIAFALASLTCALAPNGIVLAVARLIAGLGLGAFFSTALLTIVGTAPKRDLPGAMTALTLVLLIAPTIAPLASIALLASASWRALFFVAFLIAVALAFIVDRIMKDVTGPTPSPIDGFSVLALAAAIIAFHLAATPSLMGGALVGNVAIVIAVAAAALFAWRELRGSNVPLLDLRVFKVALIGIGLSVALLVGTLVQGAGFAADFMRSTLHLDSFTVGWISAARVVGVLVGVAVIGAADKRSVPAPQVMIAGLVLVCLTDVAQALANANGAAPVSHICIGIVQAFALTIVIGPLASTLFGAVDRAQFASLTVLFKLAMLVGGAVVLAIADIWRDGVGIWYLVAFIALVAAVLTGRAKLPVSSTTEAPKTA